MLAMGGKFEEVPVDAVGELVDGIGGVFCGIRVEEFRQHCSSIRERKSTTRNFNIGATA